MTEPARDRRYTATLLAVAGLNFAYFWVEMSVALAIGSVSLFADSVDFLEDTAINLLILIGLGWSLAWRARLGKVMAAIICVPALAGLWQAVAKFSRPDAPEVVPLVVTAGGAVVVNLAASLLLARHRDRVGSLSTAAFLAARNDVIVNAAVIVMALITWGWHNGWPDIALGLGIVALNFHSAWEVWEAATEETRAAA